MRHRAKFHQNRSNGCDLKVFFETAAIRHLGFVGHVLGPPTMTKTWIFEIQIFNGPGG